MQAIIRQITTQLRSLDLLPVDITLCKVDIVVLNSTFDTNMDTDPKPVVKIKARQNTLYYTVDLHLIGYPFKKATLTFLQVPPSLGHKITFGPRSGHSFFDAETVEAYLNLSGDSNPIHRGNFPIVPGLLMMDWVLEHHQLKYDQITFRFQKPLFINHHFTVETTSDGYALMQGPITLMTININQHLKGETHEQD